MDLLEVKNLRKSFHVSDSLGRQTGGRLVAVDNISFSLKKGGETLGLVGESGCGKSTTAKLIMQLQQPDSGHVYFNNQDLAALSARQLRLQRKQIQMIFQDPFSSLNPRMTVGSILSEPFAIHKLAPHLMRSGTELLNCLKKWGADL